MPVELRDGAGRRRFVPEVNESELFHQGDAEHRAGNPGEQFAQLFRRRLLGDIAHEEFDAGSAQWRRRRRRGGAEGSASTAVSFRHRPWWRRAAPAGAMFKNTFQSGFLSVLYSIGSKPLQIWDKKVRNGHIKRITDNDIQSLVLEIEGTNVSTTYITCPADPKKTLGIKLPFLVMIIKNLKKYFTFEVQVLDDKNVRRRFRASNYQSTTRVKPFICTMPMRLDDGWNQIQFNLSDFTRRAYGTNYIETLRVQIHANCRIRRVYFSDRLYSEDELPAEFKLYLPVQNKAKQ